VSRLEGLDPHQTSLVVLNAHDTLSTVHSAESVLGVDACILEVWSGDVDGGIWSGLEAELAVPGHVLDCKQGSVAGGMSVVTHVVW